MTEFGFADYRAIPMSVDDAIIAKWRGIDWSMDKITALTASPAEKLAVLSKIVNDYVTYTTDLKDNWQSPATTLVMRTGDCEDIAILKYGYLLAAGTPHSSLRLVVGEVKKILANEPHAWLAVLVDGQWYALDNLFDHVIRIEDYVNWHLKYAMHGDDIVRYGREFRISDVIGGAA